VFCQKASPETSPQAKKAFDIHAAPDKFVMPMVEYARPIVPDGAATGAGGRACVTGRFTATGKRTTTIQNLAPQLLPSPRRRLSTLFTDLSDAACSTRTLVVITGEFGRRRASNKQAGRDLGRAGRNFAAGMSAASPTLLDEKGDLPDERCKPGRRRPSSPMDTGIFHLLRHWITNHFEATEARGGNGFWENCRPCCPKFIKIFPHRLQAGSGILEERSCGQTASLASSIATIAVNKQVIHG